jgi:tripartite ATP-independent transporter DctP family solute receptor
MRNIRVFLTGLAIGAAAAGAFAQTTVIKAWNIHPDGYPVTEAMKQFVDEVNQGTGGRYRIELYSNAALGDQPKAVQMIKSGEIDAAEFSIGPLSEAVPGLKALNLPFLFPDSQNMFDQLAGPLGDKLAAQLKAAGYTVVGWYDGGARSFYCTKKKLANVNDFKGLKIRVQQSEVYMEMIKALDATPVPLPFKDVGTALQQGQVDCAENNLPSIEATGHYKVAKYVYLTNHIVSPEALVVSTRLWNKLSPQDQKVFAQAGQKSALLMRALWNRRVDEARDILAKSGVQFTRVRDYSPLVRRMRALHGKYMADPQTREQLLTILATGATAK